MRPQSCKLQSAGVKKVSRPVSPGATDLSRKSAFAPPSASYESTVLRIDPGTEEEQKPRSGSALEPDMTSPPNARSDVHELRGVSRGRGADGGARAGRADAP